MINLDNVLLFIEQLSILQIGLLLLSSVSWFWGGFYLRQKHKARLEREGIKYSVNLNLGLITVKEWLIFTIHVIFTMALLVAFIWAGKAS